MIPSQDAPLPSPFDSCSADERYVQPYASVVDQVSGLGAVGTIQDEVVRRQEGEGGRREERAGMRDDGDVRVEAVV
jgi:hypothetical protein